MRFAAEALHERGREPRFADPGLRRIRAVYLRVGRGSAIDVAREVRGGQPNC
jgi:hypothetical protein